MALSCYRSPTFNHYGIFKGECISQFTAIAPSPHKDFYHLLITKEKFFWRWWRITPRREAAKFSPGETVDTYDEFLTDEKVQKEIRRILGPKAFNYCENIASGLLDFLPRMPPAIIKRITRFLRLEDIVNLECTCKTIAEACNDQSVWKALYFRHHPGKLNDVVQELARLFGWKRVFFTSKLKLQMQIRRLRLEHGGGDEESNSLLSSTLSESLDATPLQSAAYSSKDPSQSTSLKMNK